MCCIFTCCGWMIDLIQRLWTFTMACCISSAVCCSLLTASLSGIALGYNYSLAEYIDLKETNVSIYLKRGIFDDEIADDIDWRRSGHKPVAGHIKEDNLMTEPEDQPLKPARRLDDSILESNDKNNFEGALLKLTAKPPDFTTKSPTTPPIDLSQPTDSKEDRFEKLPIESEIGRRMMNQMPFDIPTNQESSTSNSLRLAVPDIGIVADKSQWRRPPPPDQYSRLYYNYSPKDSFTLPSPITSKPGPARPTRPRPHSKLPFGPTLTSLKPAEPKKMGSLPPKDLNVPDDNVDSFKEKLFLDKFDSLGFDDDFRKRIKAQKGEDDYEEDIKGIPLRKKRDSGFQDTKQINEVQNEKLDKTTILSKLMLNLSKTLPLSIETDTTNNIAPLKTFTETNTAFKSQIFTGKILKTLMYSNI
ncbi:unnamed protein product [Leptidea sinapis]|uniref:Uncharacterized protein n=1 Tax=Leptidea sinapis TaxID=189913 RepID=A0A5E4QGY2_9NEOP|nr:unnamed protein product [Leptidea sinapis]